MARSIGSQAVADFFDTLSITRSLPEVIVCDYGPEFTSMALDRWAERHHVKQSFIQSGKLQQNGFIESFNGNLREECLDEELVYDLADAQAKIETWRTDYNEHRRTVCWASAPRPNSSETMKTDWQKSWKP